MKKLVLLSILAALTVSSADASLFYSRKKRDCIGNKCSAVDKTSNFLFTSIRCWGPGEQSCPTNLPEMTDDEMNGLILLADKSLNGEFSEESPILVTAQKQGVISSPNYKLRFVKFNNGYNIIVHDKGQQNMNEVFNELYSE